jgi:hypothetical protein
MSKISGPGAPHQARRGCARRVSTFDAIPRGSDDRHPIDIAVDRRAIERVRSKAIVSLQEKVLSALGQDKTLYLDLEVLINKRQRGRERCYFDLGFEHGVTVSHARRAEMSSLKVLSPLAVTLRKHMRRAKVANHVAVVALLECAIWHLHVHVQHKHRAVGDRGKDDVQET